MRRLLVPVAVLSITGVAGAQRPGQFDAASVKLAPAIEHGPGTPLPSIRLTGTRLDVRDCPLPNLLAYAFGNPRAPQLVYPGSLRTLSETRLEIQALVPTGSSKADVQQMLRQLLAQRMALKFHQEPRVIAAYDLVVDPAGPRMQAVEEADERGREFTLGKYDLDLPSFDGEYRRIMTIEAGGSRMLTARSNYLTTMVPRNAPAKYLLDATRITMPDLASELSGRAGRPVFDATGLTGVYAFSIELPMPNQAAMLQRLADSGITTTKSGDPLDSGFGPARVDLPKELAKLGLRLVDRKSPVDVIVIDNINRTPTEN
jgi:uncharacterized protein (TIGR03435 family)